MKQPKERTAYTPRGTPASLQWGMLLIASIVFVWLLKLIGLPAALLLGSTAAAIFIAAFEDA